MPGHYGYCTPGYEATEHPSNMDIAWAAGIFEGEGTASRNNTNSNFAIVVQKDRWLIDRFRALFGGSVRIVTRKPNASFKGGEYYEWNASGARARGFLMTVYKFLSPRRKEQVKFALGLRDNPNIKVASAQG